MRIRITISWTVSGYRHGRLGRLPRPSLKNTMAGIRGSVSVRDLAPGIPFIRHCYLARSCLETGRGTRVLPWTRSTMEPISNCCASLAWYPLRARAVSCRPNRGMRAFETNAKPCTGDSVSRVVRNLPSWSFNQISGAVRYNCLLISQPKDRQATQKPCCRSMLPTRVGRCSTKRVQTATPKPRSCLQRFACFGSMGRFERPAVSFHSRKHSDSNQRVRQLGGC